MLSSATRAATFVLLVLFASFAPAHAAKPSFYQNIEKVAVNGYDVVAYFTMKKPVEGSAEHVADYKGATFRFSSAAHRDLFKANPAKYAPQYGGYCAFAVSSGYTAPTVPEAWAVVGGKLYLNYSRGVKARWDEDQAGHIKRADANWPKVLTK